VAWYRLALALLSHGQSIDARSAVLVAVKLTLETLYPEASAIWLTV
jgi:uncharacterized membrane protein YidH (DUF202 family)